MNDEQREQRIDALTQIDGPLTVDEAAELRRLETEQRLTRDGWVRDR